MHATLLKPNGEPKQLALLSEARVAIQRASSLREVRDIRDKAEAIRMYAKARGESFCIQQEAAEVKLRAERKAGELLAGMEKSSNRFSGSTLEPLGIEKHQSHRWQRIATLPEPAFEDFIETTKAAEKELTTAGALSRAKAYINQERNETMVAESESASVSDLYELISAGKTFGTIYADPPWKYGNQATRASTDNHYPTMTVDEICALPVKELAAEQSHLWLWTTNGFLFDCPRVFDAWGFEFKSSYVWVKSQMGIGNYLRNAHEFLLLAIRGGLRGGAKNVRSWGEFPRGKHSAKPEQVRANVIEKTSPGPRLELFGRSEVVGWTVWGNQVAPREKGFFDGNA